VISLHRCVLAQVVAFYRVSLAGLSLWCTGASGSSTNMYSGTQGRSVVLLISVHYVLSTLVSYCHPFFLLVLLRENSMPPVLIKRENSMPPTYSTRRSSGTVRTRAFYDLSALNFFSRKKFCAGRSHAHAGATLLRFKTRGYRKAEMRLVLGSQRALGLHCWSWRNCETSRTVSKPRKNKKKTTGTGMRRTALEENLASWTSRAQEDQQHHLLPRAHPAPPLETIQSFTSCNASTDEDEDWETSIAQFNFVSSSVYTHEHPLFLPRASGSTASARAC
jgi:hypothetical protein